MGFYSQLYLILQFTRVGFLCGIAGYFLIFYNLEQEKCDIALGFDMVLGDINGISNQCIFIYGLIGCFVSGFDSYLYGAKV